MPRIKMRANDYAANDFAQEIRVAGAKKGLFSATAIADCVGMNRDVLRRKLREPKSLKLGDILKLMEALDMGPETLEPLGRRGKVS